MDSDPWNWSVEQVQQFFSNEAAGYISDLPSRNRLPTLEPFLQTLDDNDVTGATLLTDIDSLALRDDFGIKPLGARSAVLRCIVKLRRQSRIYGAEHDDVRLQTPSSLPTPTLPAAVPPDAIVPSTEILAVPKRSDEVQVEDVHGRKRRKLEPLAMELPKRMVLDSESTRKGYLDNSAYTFNEMFYGQTAFGAEIGQLDAPGDILVLNADREAGLEDNNFQLMYQNKTAGEATYVHSNMLHFLNKPNELDLRRGGREAFAVFPYQEREWIGKQAATVLQFRDGEPVAVMERADNLHSRDMPSNSPPRDEWDLLAKKYKSSENDILPLYGESDHGDDADDEESSLQASSDDERKMAEEGEDEDEDEDYEAENERVLKVVDEVIQTYIENWKAKLPKLEAKEAWTVWKKTKQSRTLRDLMIQGARSKIEHLTRRLGEMRLYMLKRPLLSNAQIPEKCVALEPTVLDIEEEKWKVSVWLRKREPSHVVRHSTQTRKRLVENADAEQRGPGFKVHASDRFSVEPAPEDQINGADIDEEILYDADDDEEFLTPGNSTANSRAATPHLEESTNASNEGTSDLGDETSIKDEADTDLPALPVDVEDLDNRVDDDYVPEDPDSEFEKDFDSLPSPSTFARRVKPSSSAKVVDLTMSTSESSSPRKPGRRARPAKKIKDPHGEPTDATAAEVALWDYSELVKKHDRLRILIRLLSEVGPKLRDRFDDYLRSPGISVFTKQLYAAMWSKRNGITSEDLRGDMADTMMEAANIFEVWAMPTLTDDARRSLDQASWRSVCTTAQLGLFTNMLASILRKKASKLFLEPKPSSSTARNASNPIYVSSGDSEMAQERTPHKKRKKEVQRSAAAQDARTSALDRAKRYNESQTTDPAYLATMLASDPSYSSLEINPVKNEGDDFIYVPDKIAKKMKAHQIEGTRFIWREITADGKDGGQGCVLAHTMGLGKTMQTIAALVAINEAAQSNQSGVYNQLPEHLRLKKVRGERHLRVLILMPPALIQNWHREIDQWTSDELGAVFSLESTNKNPHAHQLKQWMRIGGVLLVGYELFRSMLGAKPPKSNSEIQERLSKFQEHLLKGPDIVVADEAHRLKNQKSSVAQYAARFETESRIALTGTPMSNNVEEIYAVVSWVAPGFLGNPTEFKAHYAEPIQEGLYSDSTPWEKRKSIKKLKVLQAEIEPKVNRANIEVLRGSLKPKIEYIITVPLGTVQTDLYRKYIEVLARGDKTAKASTVTIFGWLNTLTLLTNHPWSFYQRLLNPPDKKAKKRIEEIMGGLDVSEGALSPTPAAENGSVSPLEMESPEPLAEAGAETEDGHGATPDLDNTEVREILHAFQGELDPTLSAKATVFFKLAEYSLEVGDKILVFSSFLRTLDYLGKVFIEQQKGFGRIDGSTSAQKRVDYLKRFHDGEIDVMLVATRAGGVGLNIQGANRVFLFDFGFNPAHEEQAIGRAYRIGQTKPVYVYRFMTGGTFEEKVYETNLYKTSLAQRVVDKKNPRRNAQRNAREYLHEPKPVPQKNLEEWIGKDQKVLDRLLARQSSGEGDNVDFMIRSIQTMETLQEEAMDEPLNEEEQKEVNLEIEQSKMRVRGKKAVNGEAAMPPPPATANRRSGMVSFPIHAEYMRQYSSTMPASNVNNVVAPPPMPTTVAAAIARLGTPRTHSMAGLPMTQPPGNGAG